MFAKRFVLLVTAASILAAPGAAHANGDAEFSVRGYRFGGETGAFYGIPDHEWVLTGRLTVCTSSGARIRLRAITYQPGFDITATSRFVRRQEAGCKRYRFRAPNDTFHEADVRSRLRVAWRDRRLRTGRRLVYLHERE